jgi:hypothetical protein
LRDYSPMPTLNKDYQKAAILPSQSSVFYVSLIIKENLTNNGAFPKNRRTEISETAQF